MAAKRTTIYFTDYERRAVKELRARYGFSTDSQAIRFALRALLQGNNSQ